MNTVLIIFLVLVIIIAIYIAVQYFNPNYLINKPASLNLSSASPNRTQISASSFDDPGSSRYFYEGWIFINGNMPVQTENVLFNRGNNFVVSLLGSTLNIYVNTMINGGSGVSSVGILDTTKGIKPLVSINNFPFQKWAQLVINVDGNIVDTYIDGKFVQSQTNSTVINVNMKDPITYGNQHTLGYITRFRRPSSGINPQGVWNSYMSGSGQNMSISSSHLNLQVTKNKMVKVDQRLF